MSDEVRLLFSHHDGNPMAGPLVARSRPRNVCDVDECLRF